MYRGPGVVKRSPKKPRHEGICLNQKDCSIFYQGSFFVGAAGCAIPLSIVTNPPASGSSTPIACFGPDSSTYNLLPAGLEGAAFAPLGTPGLYLQFVNSGSASGSTLNLYKFQWSGSSGTLVGPTSISVPEFHEACGGGACVPQYGTKELLDSLGDRLMYRLSYLGAPYDQMVVNQDLIDVHVFRLAHFCSSLWGKTLPTPAKSHLSEAEPPLRREVLAAAGRR